MNMLHNPPMFLHRISYAASSLTVPFLTGINLSPHAGSAARVLTFLDVESQARQVSLEFRHTAGNGFV
jgi:hypothetical protein